MTLSKDLSSPSLPITFCKAVIMPEASGFLWGINMKVCVYFTICTTLWEHLWDHVKGAVLHLCHQRELCQQPIKVKTLLWGSWSAEQVGILQIRWEDEKAQNSGSLPILFLGSRNCWSPNWVCIITGYSPWMNHQSGMGMKGPWATCWLSILRHLLIPSPEGMCFQGRGQEASRWPEHTLPHCTPRLIFLMKDQPPQPWIPAVSPTQGN